MESKIWHKWSNYTKTDHGYGEQICVCQQGGSGIDRVFGVGRCKLLHLEWISYVVLLCSTGTYVQSLVIEHDGRKYEKENVYVYMTGSIYYTTETDTTL